MTLINDITSILDPSGLLQISIDAAALEGLDFGPDIKCESEHDKMQPDCSIVATHIFRSQCRNDPKAICHNRALFAFGWMDDSGICTCGRLARSCWTFIPLGDI